MGIALVFVLGVATGVLASGLMGAVDSELPAGDARLVGCGANVTLIVDAGNLSDRTYELRASFAAREGALLPLINSMTHPLVGTHRGYQSLVPHDGRLLVVANVPVGKDSPLRYELVDGDAQVVLDGALPHTCT